jgi:hypothetical protein
MIKWFVYIVFLLVFTPYLLSAKTKLSRREYAIGLQQGVVFSRPVNNSFADTVKTLKTSTKPDAKVKEVAKSKKQPKPEKVDDTNDKKGNTGRQRRPDGMVRPPEIPRRNDN